MTTPSDAGAPTVVDWVARALVHVNTAPPTVKTDETTPSEREKTGQPTAITDEIDCSSGVSSVMAVTLAVLESAMTSSEPAEPSTESIVNPGMLMTVGHYHGYPRLPLKPGVSIAECATAWRTFTNTADADMLALAAASARATWSDDPMTNDLYYVAPIDPDAGEPCRNENGVCQDQEHNHFDFDDFFDDHRAEQEDRHLERGTRMVS